MYIAVLFHSEIVKFFVNKDFFEKTSASVCCKPAVSKELCHELEKCT